MLGVPSAVGDSVRGAVNSRAVLAVEQRVDAAVVAKAHADAVQRAVEDLQRDAVTPGGSERRARQQARAGVVFS